MGIEKTVIRVPDIIDGVWFRRWVTEELAKADIRNATAVGATITTDAYGRPVLTFDVSTDITAHNADPLAHPDAFAAHRSEYDPHPNYLMDAPIDGNEYVRKNGAWAVVSPSVTVGASALALEGGGVFLLESGDRLLLEETPTTSLASFLLEGGGYLLLEDGTHLLME